MNPRSIRFTETARGHVHREKAWWIENRTHTEIFVTELEEALRVVALLPGSGTPYAEAGVGGLRRIYLRKIACHIYYLFDEHDVIVRALWGALRGHGPRLGS